MLKKLFSIIILLSCTAAAHAQELYCKVRVMADKIQNQNVDKELFTNLERSITEFMNTRKWTPDEFKANERIECNILINLTTKLDAQSFEGTLSIQATRPVFNSGYNTPIINFIDRDIQFSFTQYGTIQFDDNRVSGNNAMIANLPAILAYYAYLVIGLDYESFSPKGGTEYFKKAQNIVNNAPEQGKTIKGWKAVEGNRNRYWITDQMMNPRFDVLRTFWYTMHREALDNMYTKPDESRKLILKNISKLAQLNKENPSSILLQFFFNAKSDEMVSILAQVPKQERAPYIAMLQQIDVPNTQKYNNLK
jgi:hypothetical protein